MQAAEAGGAAGDAEEAVGPADADRRLLALGVGAVEVEEGSEAEAFLELDLVLGPEGGGRFPPRISLCSYPMLCIPSN